MIIEHDPDGGCEGCRFRGSDHSYDDMWDECRAYGDEQLGRDTSQPAPTWCPLRTGPVTVRSPEGGTTPLLGDTFAVAASLLGPHAVARRLSEPQRDALRMLVGPQSAYRSVGADTVRSLIDLGLLEADADGCARLTDIGHMTALAIARAEFAWRAAMLGGLR
jgi:hypothetical protein